MTRAVSALLMFLYLLAAATMPACSKSPTQSQPTAPYQAVREVEWAKLNGQSLSCDIYTPQTGQASYPVVIIYHGGGWLINTKAVMDSMSVYLVGHGEYVVCNVNYRLLGDQNNTVTLNQIVEDALGAVLWVKDHIAAFKGDPNRIVVTGDSAGGQLAAMVVLSGGRLESDGFAGATFGFNPTYLPQGKTAEQVAAENGLTVQAAVLNYAAFDLYASCLGGFEQSGNFFWSFAGKSPRGIFGNEFTVQKDAPRYQAVSPIYNIPQAAERALPPQLCTVGSKDNLVTPLSVRQYVQKLEENGHTVEYWEHEGRPHAFLDSGRNDFLGTEFRKDAPPALDRMLDFLNGIFYR